MMFLPKDLVADVEKFLLLDKMFVSRTQWGARPPKYVNSAVMSAESTCHYNGPTITVGGKLTWDHAACAGLVRGIQNFHMDSRGWSDIAYNFVVCPHGYVFQGRSLNVINGANGTNSGNRSSHAVMCLGGVDNAFSDAEKLGFRECIKYIDAQTSAPGTCRGHRDWHSTACPGDERYKWVHAGMPVPNITPIPEEDEDMAMKIHTLHKDPTPSDPNPTHHVYLVSGLLATYLDGPSLQFHELIKTPRDPNPLGYAVWGGLAIMNGPLKNT